MVVKIMKSTGSMKSPLEYNGRKVREGGAEVLSLVNIPDGDVQGTFQFYENANIRSKDVSFHMSFNPAPEEKMDDGKVRECIGELMEGLGYGDQPYVIYRHTDIEREHFHVVSIRTDRDGKKIRDFYERRNCLNILHGLSRKYGFSVGKDSVLSVSHDEGELFRFNPRGTDVVMQLSMLASACCTFRFYKDDEFKALMRQCGVRVVRSTADPSRLLFQGLDGNGRKCTGLVSESALKMDVGQMVNRRIRECLAGNADLGADRRRVSRDVNICIGSSASERVFLHQLASCGIGCTLERGRNGAIEGVYFTDMATRTVFGTWNLPEVRTDLLKEMDEKVWSQEEQSVADKVLDTFSGLVDCLGSDAPAYRKRKPAVPDNIAGGIKMRR